MNYPNRLTTDHPYKHFLCIRKIIIMQKLTFNVSNKPVLVFSINHETKTAKLLNTPHELSASILLTQNERTYQGIENRLNFLTNKNLTLQEQIQSIKKGEFYADAQRNLSIMVEP